MSIGLDDLNADHESWLTKPLSAEVQARAVMARTDYGAFCKLALAFQEIPYIWHPVHDLIVESIVQAEAAGMKLELVMPPGLGKTTITQLFPPFKLGQDPTNSIGFISYSEGTASENLIMCRKMLCSPLMQWMFPHVQPSMGGTKGTEGSWSMKKLYLRGQHRAACEAKSVLSDVAGRRRKILIFDDVVTQECQESELILDKVTRRINSTWLTRLPPQGGFAMFVNNCWHRDDFIHTLRLRAADFNCMCVWVGYDWECDNLEFNVYNPPPSWKASGLETQGRFPLWDNQPRANLLERRADVPSFKRIYMQQAVVAEDSWLPHPSKWSEYEPGELPGPMTGAKCVAYLDPAGGKNVKKSDYAAMLFGIKAADGTLFIVDVFCAKVSPPDQIRALWFAHKRALRLSYPGLYVAQIEILSKDESWLRTKEWIAECKEKEPSMARLSWSYDYAEKLAAKDTRIAAMFGPLNSGDIRFPKNFIEQTRGTYRGPDPWDEHTRQSWSVFLNQCEDFGSKLAPHDDGPDALSGLYRLAKSVYAGPLKPREPDPFGLSDRVRADIKQRGENLPPPRRHSDGTVIERTEAGKGWSL